MRDELVEAVARAMWADMLKSGQANDMRDWEARSGKDGEWEWRSPAVDDRTKARIRSAARAALAAAEPAIRAEAAALIERRNPNEGGRLDALAIRQGEA